MEPAKKRDYVWTGLIIGWLLVIALSIVIFNAKRIKSFLESNNRILQQNEIIYKNKIGTLTTRVGTLQLTQKQLKEQVISKDEKLKKVTAGFNRISNVLKFRVSARIDTAKVNFSTPITFDSITGQKISPFSREGNYEKDWLCFDYHVNNTGLELYSATATINTTSVIGFKRNWFLGRNYAVTEVTPEEKNVTIVNVSSIQTYVPVKWYDTKAFNLAAGFILSQAANRIKL